MLFQRSASEARTRQRPALIEGRVIGELYDYFDKELAASLSTDGDPAQGMDCPQAYLVVQQPNTTIDAHFHFVDQFQVAVQGGGLIGRHKLHDIVVHYSNAHTTYGPIIAADEGISYFTLRNTWDRTRAHPMPKSRAELLPVRRRHVLMEPFQPASTDELSKLAGPRQQTLFESDGTGLGAWRHQLPPHGRVEGGPDPSSGAGQYWIVLSGSIRDRGGDMDANSCLFATADEPACAVSSGEEGLDLLILQFPHPRMQNAEPRLDS